MFFCHYRAAKIMTGLKDDEILYFNYMNEIYKSPFYVFYDHENRQVVISIRGSLSIEDVTTDLSASYQKFEVPGIADAPNG